MSNITITWYADDGYVCGDRPKRIVCDPDDFVDCDSEESVNEMLSQCLQEEFEQKVSWCADNFDDHVKAIWARVQKARAESKGE
jgi:hypothetical protein